MLDIPALIDEAKKAKIRVYPVHANRASEIGHPCERYLVYQRTRWQEKKPHDLALQRVFDLGRLFERQVIQDLQEAGIYLEEQQRAFSEPRYQLTGMIDGRLPFNGRKYPVEIKSMSPFIWEAINSQEDLRRAKYPYLRGYYDQMQVYLFQAEEEKGLLLAINKVSGALKQIVITLDYGYTEEILRRCERINAHVAAGTLPDPILDEAVCGNCGYGHICLPDRDFGAGLEVLDNAELEALLSRREALAPAVREYREVDESIKRMLQGKTYVRCGGWEIHGKLVSRKEYTVPAGEYWQLRIIRLKEEEK